MGLRPAKCYKTHEKPAFSRIAITVPRKNYIGAAPAMRIRQFNMGNPRKKFSHIADLLIMEQIQIRDNALESMRTTVNRFFFKHIGKDAYFLKIRTYPHQILRENKQATGAGADRIQKGMSHPYGRPIGRASRIHAGQTIMSALVDEDKIALAQQGLKKASSKLGCKVKVRVGTDVESIGTKPKKVREIEEKKTDEKKEGKEDGKKSKKEEGKETDEKTAETKGKEEKASGKKSSEKKK
ncbi:50S ribosomal protein L16 [Candidatus Micrarchaeota archaeon]|nr:50S ribosomal protein L16 [Candidatus Micrarchaeota archaeon]MBU1930391.1 50S ribosomal protein L16 [Candidatus Micrarchaeota archaeon]